MLPKPRSGDTCYLVRTEIEWSSLSPASREILGIVGLRMAAGWTSAEIAAELERPQPQLRHQPQPMRFSTAWIAACLGELRDEIREQPAMLV